MFAKYNVLKVAFQKKIGSLFPSNLCKTMENKEKVNNQNEQLNFKYCYFSCEHFVSIDGWEM